MLSDDDKKKIHAAFRQAVNMPQASLRKWLDREESRHVGMTASGEKVTHDGQDEAVGHRMGREILELLGRPESGLSEDEYHAMRKVSGYVHRHLAQRPKGDVSETRWRQSLMNWGHDPLKDG